MRPGCSQGAQCGPGTGQGTHCQHRSCCLLHKTCQAQAPSLFPKGTVPSLSPSITRGSCFNQGIPCLLPTTGGPGREGKLPPFTCLHLLCPSRGQRTPSPTPGREPFGNRVGGGPFDQPSLLGSGLGGVTRHSPPRCRFPHTSALVKVTLSCTCPDRCLELRDQEPPGAQVTDREGGTYLPLLGGWTTSRTGHKHGAAGESWLVLARRGEQQLTQRAPWPRLLPASPPPPPGAQKGPPREIGATQRAAASSRQGRQSHTPRLASRTNVTAIGLFLLWRH